MFTKVNYVRIKKVSNFRDFCDRERSRTHNLQSRNLTLYPIELRGQNFKTSANVYKVCVNQKLFSLLIFLLLLFSCKEPSNNIDKEYLKHTTTVKISTDKDSNIILFYPNLRKTIAISKKELPIKNCYVITTPTIGYLSELGLIKNVKGICNPEYVYNEELFNRVLSNEVENLGNEQNFNLEKMISSDTNFIFTSYNANLQNTYKLLEDNGKKIIFIEDYKEQTPLGKAEIIKIFGRLFNKVVEAENKFKIIKSNYIYIKSLATKIETKPTAFAKIMYGDVWFVPQGNSISATYYSDAGFNYLWKNTLGEKSLELSFENVFQKAENADFWLDVSDVENKEFLLNFNEFYRNFKAYKTSRMFAISGRKNSRGANDFYESGCVRVDWILNDLAFIAHPKQFAKHKLIYYKQLK